MDPHVHAEALMGIVVRGGFVERIGRRARDYAQGQFAYLPAGMEHSQRFGPHGARQIIFRPQPHWLEYLAECRTPLQDSPHANSPTLRVLGERLLREVQGADAFSAVACEGLILELIAAFGRTRTAGRAGTPPPWLCAVRDFVVEQRLGAPSMRQLAALAGRHEVHVAREFRRFFGSSVGTYARRLRAERVARLLLRPRASIAEIALECAFSSHAHLCREFKAHFGLTPSDYRRGAL
jgi:AraC family transcriptional regulator